MSNKRPVERLNEFGILKDNTIAVHCVYVNEEEIDILKIQIQICGS